MWMTGTVTANGIEYRYYIKRYDEPSEFGIDKGRISKLQIMLFNKEVANYDRGWDLKPRDANVQEAMQKILEKYN